MILNQKVLCFFFVFFVFIVVTELSCSNITQLLYSYVLLVVLPAGKG